MYIDVEKIKSENITKDTQLKVTLTKEKKDQFKNWCELNGVSMAKAIENFIDELIKHKNKSA